MLRSLEEPTKKKSNQFEPPISIRKKTTRKKKNPQFYRFDDYGDIGCIVYYIVYIYKSIYPIVYSVILLLSSILIILCPQCGPHSSGVVHTHRIKS